MVLIICTIVISDMVIFPSLDIQSKDFCKMLLFVFKIGILFPFYFLTLLPMYDVPIMKCIY